MTTRSSGLGSSSKRVPLVTGRKDVAKEAGKFFDEVVSGFNGEVVGPYAVMLHSPDLASRVARTADYIRFHSTLPRDVYKLLVLVATREMDCQYAWTVQQRTAKDFGVRPEAVAAIRNKKAPEGLTKDEALVVTYVQQLLRKHRVSEATFKAALKKFGLQGLVEMTVAVGHYGTLACALNAFEVEPESPDLPV